MPRIYVADLAEYNAGNLVGLWIDLSMFDDVEDLLGEIETHVLRKPQTGHEEWAIHDYEGFYGAGVGEYDSLDRVLALAKAIDEHGEPFALFVSHFGLDVGEATEAFADAYIGEMSAEDYAYELIQECYLPEFHRTYENSQIRDTFENYFDYEKFARDLVLGGDVDEVKTSDYRTHLFRGSW